MAINKVIYGDQTLLDLTDDTVSSDTMLYGTRAHDRSGEVIEGTVIIPEPAIASPLGLGEAAVGTSLKYAREDHVHEMPTASDVGALPNTTAIPSKTSDLVNDSNFITGMFIASYGSSTYAEVLAAYQANKIIYCRASSNADPGSGNQLRQAFLAYVNNQTTPTEFEFQYYRSVSSHTYAQQGDQIFIYKLNSSGTWSVTTREAYTKIVPGTGLSSAYNGGVLTLSNTAALPTGGSTSQVLKKNSATAYDVAWADQTQHYPSALCTTAAGTAAKEANCSLYVATANSYLHVLIGAANSYAGAITLNVNSTGAKPIYINGAASSAINYTLPAGSYIVFYDGTNYYFRTDGKLTADITGVADGNIPKVGSITTTTTWTQQTSDWTQTVTVTGATVTAASKVDLQPDTAALTQLISDGVTALYIENNDGTLTAHSIGAAPSVALTLQCTVTEVE